VKKLLEKIWEPFDSSDSVEWFLLLFGWTVLVILTIGGMLDWIGQ